MGSFVLSFYIYKMKLLILVLFFGFSNAFRLPKIFQSGMVLQAQPTDAVIWGFLEGNFMPVDVIGSCVLNGEKFTFSNTYIPKKDDDKFQSIVPGGEGQVCEFTIFQQGSEEVVLENVIYGDVWVCSGQSNMEWTMASIYNASEEIAAMTEYPNIR